MVPKGYGFLVVEYNFQWVWITYNIRILSYDIWYFLNKFLFQLPSATNSLQKYDPFSKCYA